MFKIIRRILIVLSLIGIIVCVVLLSNYTPRNPTHRRYSSDTPRVSGKPTTVGAAAESILSKDLDLPRNDQSGQLQCICGGNGITQGRCRSCIVQLYTVDTFRIPDFVSDKMIIEAKNEASLYYPQDFVQLEDYVEAAKSLHVPLWIYVRVDTEVNKEYFRLAESTGGKVVRYFTYPGYKDPFDEAAKKGLFGCIPTFLLSSVIEFSAGRRKRPAKQSPAAVIDELEDFTLRVKSRAQSKLDQDGRR